MSKSITLFLTSGDIDGIGAEVTAKALETLGPQNDVRFVFWRSPQCSNTLLERIDRQFQRKTVDDWSQVENSIEDLKTTTLLDINSPASPAQWVTQSAHACYKTSFRGLVTAPLSKTTIHDAGYQAMGHTELLADVAGANDLFMGFLGRYFNVLLTTGHLPLSQVRKELDQEKVKKALYAANHMRSWLQPGQKEQSIGVLGLNPHAGEQGLLGNEEKNIIVPALRQVEHEVPCEGPLVPDAAFSPNTLSSHSLYLSMYHDQGLIPFKAAHSQTGIQITLGLPFVRTSVDHGTAKNIFGQGLADPRSMIEAIQWAIQLTKSAQNTQF